MNKEVRIVSFEDLSPLARAARRERLSFKPTQNTVWFGLFFDDELVGCGGLIWLDKKQIKARLKAAYIEPEWRGLGGYRLLICHRITHARNRGASEIQTITRHQDVFTRCGFSHMKNKKPSWMSLALR